MGESVTESVKKRSPWEMVSGLIFDEVPEKNVQTPAVAPVAAPTRPIGGFPLTSPSVAPPAVDEQALDKLEKVLQKATPKSYADFVDQYNKLSSIIPDETTRFKAALATSGGTAADLAMGLDTCLQALDGARQQFTARLEGQRKSLTEGAQAAVAATQQTVDAKRQQIAALQAEITALEGQLRAQTDDFDSKRQGLERLGQGFEAAYQQVSGRLAAQKSRISALGKETPNV
jgi:chromosome segregation ATPase